MAVVINNNSRPILIQETKQQIPCNGKIYVVPDDVADLYRDYLLVVPPPVVLYIEKANKDLEYAYKKLENERTILEEEKKIYEPLFNKINLGKAKNEKEWRAKVKRKKSYPKIDLLYSFHFDQDKKAINRLRKSIESIRKQNVNICVCVTSKECIYDKIKDLANIRYYHKHLKLDVYCKPKTINLGVKKLIKTPYFIHSDIDLIYPPKFIFEIVKYTEYPCPVRVIFNNYNLGAEYEGKKFKDYKKFFGNHGDCDRTSIGIAPGNGLIHLKSFKKINGYDENYVGYGLEDADFNMRTAYICKHIVLNDDNVNTCHLYHDTIFRDQKKRDLYRANHLYYQEKRKELIKKVGNEDVNIFDEKKHLGLIKTN